MLFQTVAGDLHRHQIGPCCCLKGGQIGLHLDRAARGVLCFDELAEQTVAYGAHDPGLAPSRVRQLATSRAVVLLPLVPVMPTSSILRRVTVEMTGQLGETSGKIPMPMRGSGSPEGRILRPPPAARRSLLSHRLFDKRLPST